eukprot:2592069-Rhodomonas_salina.1
MHVNVGAWPLTKRRSSDFAQDIDDALHVRPLGNGRTEVGVHIADVTHFVHPNSTLDEEARFRGTSVYLVQKRIDMLPSLLTTGSRQTPNPRPPEPSTQNPTPPDPESETFNPNPDTLSPKPMPVGQPSA